jgi:hypothetical protein
VTAIPTAALLRFANLPTMSLALPSVCGWSTGQSAPAGECEVRRGPLVNNP